MSKSIPEIYGSLVFNDKVMREKLPKDIYKALRKTIENNTPLEPVRIMGSAVLNCPFLHGNRNGIGNIQFQFRCGCHEGLGS